MERKAKNGWVLKPEDIWYNMYMSHNILRMKEKGTTFGKKRILTWQDACMQAEMQEILKDREVDFETDPTSEDWNESVFRAACTAYIKNEEGHCDSEMMKEIANEFFEKVKDARFSSKELEVQSRAEIETSAGELIRTVTLKPSSTYDTVFWMFFYEDNPFVMSRIKGATVLSFVVHILFICFYVKAMGFG